MFFVLVTKVSIFWILWIKGLTRDNSYICDSDEILRIKGTICGNAGQVSRQGKAGRQGHIATDTILFLILLFSSIVLLLFFN